MDAPIRPFRSARRKLGDWFTRGSRSSTLTTEGPAQPSTAVGPETSHTSGAEQHAAIRSFSFLKRKLADLFFRRSPNAAPSSAVGLETTRNTPTEQPDLESGENAGAAGVSIAVPPMYNFDWGAVIVGFCLTSAVEIALQSLQPQVKIPLLVHLLSQAMVFAFSSIFISNFISPNQFPRFVNALKLVAKLSIFIAFFLVITIPSSLFLKLFTWSIFAISFLFIVYAVAARGGLHLA